METQTIPDNRKPSQVLTEALALIDTPEKWCQDAFAKSERGLAVDSMDPSACMFCAEGALNRAKRGQRAASISVEMTWLRSAAFIVAGTTCPTRVNDIYGYEKTIEMFDKAIQIAKEREQKNAAQPDPPGGA